MAIIKGFFPSFNNIFTCALFFFLCFISFSLHTFCGLVGACVNPGSFSLFVHSLVCPITHSFLDGFQSNLVQHSPHVCPACHTAFSLKNTLECACERLLHCKFIFTITWTPDKLFACILMYHSVVKVKEIVGFSFSKLSFKVASAYMVL